MPTKTARRDYNELLPRSVTSRTQINPAPGTWGAKGARPCYAALEKRKRQLGEHVKSIYLWIAILSSNQCSKTAFLNPVPRVSLLCSAYLSHSDLQLSSNNEMNGAPVSETRKKGWAYDVTPRKAQHKRLGEARSHARVSSWERVTNTCHKLLLQNEDS